MKVYDLHNEDLSYTSEALAIKGTAEDFFKDLMVDFPNANPREMAQIIYDACSTLAVRECLRLRREMQNKNDYIESIRLADLGNNRHHSNE